MKYYRIDDKNLWQNIDYDFKKKGGVYKLHCFKGSDETEVDQLSRLLKSDANGVLYIGKANSFLDRVINLKKSLLPDYKTENHHAGIRYNKNKGLQNKFKLENLCVSLTPSSNPAKLEREELKKYEEEFCELPPFNAMS